MDFSIDFNALFGNLKNEAMISMAAATVEDPAQRKYLIEVLRTFVRHGVDADTAARILSELTKLNENKTEDN